MLLLTICFNLFPMPTAGGEQWNGQLIGFIYTAPEEQGDFAWMIRQDQFRDALFIFNDNESEYETHKSDASLACEEGANNARIRPYQCQDPPRAVGIPTGPGYLSLTPHAKQIIDEAIDRAHEIALRYEYRRIFYNAADSSGILGVRAFEVGNDVRRYIFERLKK